MSDDLDCFYALLGQLRAVSHQGRSLGELTGRIGWPARGVYFFLEPGEYQDSTMQSARVVRVGTHAVSANSKSSLWGRLRTHRGTGNGGGNHRSSIFRLHVGAALLAFEGGRLPTWGAKSSAARSIRDQEIGHERRVSLCISAMSVLWVDVPDAPGPQSDRSLIERNSIALLSNHLNPIDPPSPGWLGRNSPRAEIVCSGLWNLNYLSDHYDPVFLDTLARYVARTCQATATGSGTRP